MSKTPDYGTEGEARLRAFVETTTGGRVTRMVRQVRWRPAWFVDVEREGQLLPLHLRGDRGGDVNIFPDLKREADVIDVLHAHGVAVPRIHGYCEDPPCILMDALPGTRNVADAPSEADRQRIARDYMEQVAKMHRVPLAPFLARGLHVPQGPEQIALVGLEAYLPHYRRTKSRPEPLLEFVQRWLRRNVPKHRTQAAFIQFDSGQFLLQDGRLTGLYDFEFSMIGDPMVDIATMGMRDSYEPLGEDLRVMCRHYEEFTGQPVDHDAVAFHTLQFATVGAMQFTGTVGRPRAGDPHAVYLQFDIELRQVILKAMSRLTGVALRTPPAPAERTGDNAATLSALADAVSRIAVEGQQAMSQRDAAMQLVEWLQRSDAVGAEARAQDLADVCSLLGRRLDTWPQAEAALEAHVLAADVAEDAQLLQLFAAIEGRRMHVHGCTRIGEAARHVELPPTR